VDLTYIDDVVAAFVRELDSGGEPGACRIAPPLSSYRTSLGEIVRQIESFRAYRTTLQVPDFSHPFVRALYATYLSYLETDDFAYTLDIKTDRRGSLAEFVKSPSFGQVFVSRTKPGITRGDHYHHTKTEKFLVVEGEAVIRFRSLLNESDIIEYRVSGRDYRVVDIPPGYAHSIENVGSNEVVTLFWASEVFDAQRPDTQSLSVLTERRMP
jgi:UDP-2-acetamido-2,6-beta-L-arabino-hexul-4-ose reductase